MSMTVSVRGYISSLSCVIAMYLLFCYPVTAECEEKMVEKDLSQTCKACQQFNELNVLIRDQKIRKMEAKKQLLELMPKIKDYALKHGAKQHPVEQWIFPVEGFNIRTAGNNGGADYISSGYDYFDGNRHGGHPAFDLFINDKNQESVNDKTGEPVNVSSMTGGIVIAVEKSWDKKSKLRGGKYIWIYDLTYGALVYYAHNRDVYVSLGEIVEPGDIIATVGRTGFNAYKKRSPTHLHISYLNIVDGYPKPKNIYSILKSLKSLQ
jgi:hypothetical protein